MSIKSTINRIINNRPMGFSKTVLFMSPVFILTLITLAVYVKAEQDVIYSIGSRHKISELAEDLRQSSDDLAGMARAYIATGNPLYLQYFQDILDIRNGEKTRPENYNGTYWSFVLAGYNMPKPQEVKAMSLLELIKQESFTELELSKLLTAKLKSDDLAKFELLAMKNINKDGVIDSLAQKKSTELLNSKSFLLSKAEIMAPILDVTRTSNQRTYQEFNASQTTSERLGYLLFSFVLGFILLLIRSYVLLRRQLGGSIEDVQLLISEMGVSDSDPLHLKDGSVLEWLTSKQKLLLQDDQERKIQEKSTMISSIVFESQQGMMITDDEGKLLRVNSAFTAITGYSMQEVIGKNPGILKSGLQKRSFYTEIFNTIRKNGSWSGELWYKRKNGEIYPVNQIITEVKDVNGWVTNYVGNFTDISVSKSAAEEIERLAFYDVLTDFPNRRLLINRAQLALSNSIRKAEHGSFLFLDLDHFKTLNDTLGHEYGDMLLRKVANRIASCVRENDTVARMGGDEFVVLLEGLSGRPLVAGAQTKLIADKILKSLSRPYQLNTHEYNCSDSIGATLFKGTTVSVEKLLLQADIAMYQAKDTGRNNLRFFDQTMQDVINTRASLEVDLRNALKHKQFQLYYQVQVDAASKPVGAEALIRWMHPERGLIAPDGFIALAEETGLIIPIGLWVLETACAQLKAWEDNQSNSKLTLSINVSVKQFRQAEFAGQVQSAISRHNINPAKLKLELTESVLAGNLEDVAKTMVALNAIGVLFELDDFGTGYSSLQYLKKLPLYQLKIDKSFVRDIDSDSDNRALVQTIIVMALNLRIGVIAEGVETQEQLNFLLDNECKHFQGYFFGKPMPFKQFEQTLH